jgi:hypothetical protein
MQMSRELQPNVEPSSVKRGGRPKGLLSPQTRRMLEAWDAVQREHPMLNKEALLNLVAESVFGSRINPRIKKKEKDRLRRTLQRHHRY